MHCINWEVLRCSEKKKVNNWLFKGNTILCGIKMIFVHKPCIRWGHTVVRIHSSKYGKQISSNLNLLLNSIISFEFFQSEAHPAEFKNNVILTRNKIMNVNWYLELTAVCMTTDLCFVLIFFLISRGYSPTGSLSSCPSPILSLFFYQPNI